MRSAGFLRAVLRVQAQADFAGGFIRTVAGEAAIRKDGANVAREIHRGGGRRVQRHQDARNQSPETHAPAIISSLAGCIAERPSEHRALFPVRLLSYL